ncbi:alanyl-tRNA synthetase [Streptomyces griseocarneus]|uniref:alanyl-tRNA synthetase n=1 Tax=Streptomyces griseocarneus TaxID=51201 RepID=UPI00167D6D41|nr:alanyl-tRNA synthetase [Streptomyces griseocarneus]MBZ6475784.1 alanyl-tRNA synthetase [Streptomyces griseocarneus]GHG50803.1 alanyl-tRNA synthetase [Streptomyces griseocarneus]
MEGTPRTVGTQNSVYLTQTYTYEAKTTILSRASSAAGLRIALVDNIFHPQGGGQPSDRGWVDGIPASPVRDPDSGWVHLDLVPGSEEDLPRFSEGDVVTAAIDAEQRRLFAALHTAGHLVDALIRPFGVRHVGSNHFPGQARVEYELDGAEVDKEQMADSLREGVIKAIGQGLPISSGACDGRRTITIEGLATEFCGGTHVPDLSCLTDVSIRSVKIKSGRLKVGYEAAHAALT